jgi:hypothetical protein
MQETQNSELDFYDRIGPVTAQKVTNRHGDTQYVETPHDRRANTLEDYDWADLIDKEDKVRMIADPTSAYTVNAVNALGRAIDASIILAATGTAKTGKTGSGSVSFPSSQQIAVDFKEDGTTADSNLTVGKLREARRILDAAEAVEDGEELYCIFTASQRQALLRTTDVTSQDYNSVKALVAGEVDTFLGFKFVRTELLSKTGTDRSVLCYPKSALTLGMGRELTVEVDRLPTKRYSVQVYAAGSWGAVRMWEEKVVEVLCDETK